MHEGYHQGAGNQTTRQGRMYCAVRSEGHFESRAKAHLASEKQVVFGSPLQKSHCFGNYIVSGILFPSDTRGSAGSNDYHQDSLQVLGRHRERPTAKRGTPVRRCAVSFCLIKQAPDCITASIVAGPWPILDPSRCLFLRMDSIVPRVGPNRTCRCQLGQAIRRRMQRWRPVTVHLSPRTE